MGSQALRKVAETGIIHSREKRIKGVGGSRSGLASTPLQGKKSVGTNVPERRRTHAGESRTTGAIYQNKERRNSLVRACVLRQKNAVEKKERAKATHPMSCGGTAEALDSSHTANSKHVRGAYGRKEISHGSKGKKKNCSLALGLRFAIGSAISSTPNRRLRREETPPVDARETERGSAEENDDAQVQTRVEPSNGSEGKLRPLEGANSRRGD